MRHDIGRDLERRHGRLVVVELGAIVVVEIDTADAREQGAGRALMQGAAQSLAKKGCRSVFLWVLRDNPSRWFYQRLSGREMAHGETTVAGVRIPKTAYVWDPIDILLPTPAAS